MMKVASPVSQPDVWIDILVSGSIDIYLKGRFCHSDQMGMRSLGLSLQGLSEVHVFGLFFQKRRWNV